VRVRASSRIGQLWFTPYGCHPDERHPVNHLPLTIVGNLTSDPELRFTPQGIAVAKFTIAHNPRRLDRTTNEWVDGEATFIDCAVWRDAAEHAAESLKAGHRVIATGNLRTDRWESDGSGKTPAGEKLSRMTLDVLALGAELTFATVVVHKATRTRAGEVAPDDPWASASKERPTEQAAPAPKKATRARAAAGGRGAASSSFDDEPPF
jgi:single-strand DNA-binding protein